MKQIPISGYIETGGLLHFARMTDKARKCAKDDLREDFCENLGHGFDAWLCDFLRVTYKDVRDKAIECDSNEDVLQWCYDTGRELNENDIRIWNGYISKKGWNDEISELLQQRKNEAGLGDCDAIQTMIEFFEYDEGRKSAG